MRAINHALTGAIIGLTIAEPVFAIPAALASHYALDVIPHHGDPSKNNAEGLRSKFFKGSLSIDAFLCLALVLLLSTSRPTNWLLAVVCAATAATPDLISYRRYRLAQQHKAFTPNMYEKLARDIQWFERPAGAVVEIAWFIAGAFLLIKLLTV